MLEGKGVVSEVPILVEVDLALRKLVTRALPVRDLFCSLVAHLVNGKQSLRLVVADVLVAFLSQFHGSRPSLILAL